MSEPGRVAVTGANGHLGRRLVASLADQRPVRCIVRSARAAEQLSGLKGPGVEVNVLDYLDPGALSAAVADCSHAVHLVGILKEGSRSRYEIAHEGTSGVLARACDAQGLRGIVYPSILGSRPDSSNACLASKGRAEQLLLAAKTPTLVLRVPMVLGEGDLASRALRAQALSKRVVLTRGGASLEQPIYAGDVTAAIQAGITGDHVVSRGLDLAGPESLTRRALVERVARLHGASPRFFAIPRAAVGAAAFLLEKLSADPPLTRPMLGVLDHDDVVDPAPACRELGIELTPLDETLRLTVGPEAP